MIPKIELTEKQYKVLDFLKKFLKFNKFSPTVEEIAAGTGIKSESNVLKAFDELEGYGLARRLDFSKRSITLTKKGFSND